MDPSKTRKESTKGSGIALILLLALILAVAAVLVIFPDVLKNTVVLILMIALAVLVIVVLALLFMGVIAIPVYMKKGTTVQTDMSYSLDDVREVDGSMENRKE